MKAACLVLSLMFVCIILAIMTLVDLEARKDAAHNAKAFAAAVDEAVIEKEVGKFLTDMRALIKQLRGKYGELRSLMLGLFVPSLTLCSLTILWMVTRGHQLGRMLKTLEHNAKTREENMEMTKKEITDQLIEELCHSDTDKNTAVIAKVIEEMQY